MKPEGWAVAVVSGWMLACGTPFQPLPPAPGQTQPEVTVPDAGEPTVAPPASQSLWPLTTGSTWVYRIEDPLRGVFEKEVTVKGPSAVPGQALTAVEVVSVQPHHEERSWQLEQGGRVVRLREDDLTGGVVMRQSSWNPAPLKALSGPQPAGWSETQSFHETIRYADGTLQERDRTFLWQVVSEAESVTTPAGTFTALKVQRLRQDKVEENDNRTYWLVPGVGKVREEGDRREELVRYEVKP